MVRRVVADVNAVASHDDFLYVANGILIGADEQMLSLGVEADGGAQEVFRYCGTDKLTMTEAM